MGVDGGLRPLRMRNGYSSTACPAIRFPYIAGRSIPPTSPSSTGLTALLSDAGPPLPSPNQEKLDIMWDAREANLAAQFIDATMFHGQTTDCASRQTLPLRQAIQFQSGMFTAQTYDNRCRRPYWRRIAAARWAAR